MTVRTQHNLDVGMHEEAFASAKYKRFAAFARSRDESRLADLMARAADDCRIGNFAREMKLAGLVSDDMFNLRDVIREKTYHSEQYSQFAREAGEDGDLDAAILFQKLAADDAAYARELELASASFQASRPDTR